MSEHTFRAGIHWRRLLAAGLAAGVWVFISGLLMAASFAYRDMAAAFDSVGLALACPACP